MTAPILDASNAPETSSQVKPAPKSKLQLLVPVGILAIVAAGAGIWYYLAHPAQRGLHLSGRIEGYETDIAAKTGGRVDSIAVREGDEVKQGQLLVRINDDDVQAQLRGAIAKVASVQEQERQAQLQIAVIESQMREAQLNQQQAVGDATGRVNQAQSNVAAANAQLAAAQAQAKQAYAELKLADVNRKRYAQLLSEGAITQQQFDQVSTQQETALATLESRLAAVNSAQQQFSAAEGASTQARSTELNPAIRNAQLMTLIRQREQALADLKRAQEDVKTAIAAQQQIQAQINFLNIVSPLNGVVTSRSKEPGAVVTNGTTVLTVIDLNAVYLRGYIPEGEIGRVHVGQSAKVFLDSSPNQPLNATVSAIDSQASFTPENIYFKSDRVRQVFGVKLTLENPSKLAKPGMPADAEIVLE